MANRDADIRGLSDRDTLALIMHRCAHPGGWGATYYEPLADRILASDWLAEHDRKVAEAERARVLEEVASMNTWSVAVESSSPAAVAYGFNTYTTAGQAIAAYLRNRTTTDAAPECGGAYVGCKVDPGLPTAHAADCPARHLSDDVGRL